MWHACMRQPVPCQFRSAHAVVMIDCRAALQCVNKCLHRLCRALGSFHLLEPVGNNLFACWSVWLPARSSMASKYKGSA
jgi:hypothetical protein